MAINAEIKGVIGAGAYNSNIHTEENEINHRCQLRTIKRSILISREQENGNGN